MTPCRQVYPKFTPWFSSLALAVECQEGAATSTIFISYRREDSAGHAGRLCDYLNSLVGAARVFMDVEDITPGQRFAQTIDDTLARCDTLLVVIGPKWAEMLRQRADQPQPDYVREEIEAALTRQITIVPVLVGGAAIGQLSALPATDKLALLAQYEAAELRDSTFSRDCQRLAISLGFDATPAPKATAWKIGRNQAFIALAGVAVLGLIGIGPWNEYRARKASLDAMFATARTQAGRTDYQAAFRTYAGLLKTDPGNRGALEEQVDVAMRWLENFQVVSADGVKAEERAAALLDEIMPVLDAGLARSSGQRTRAADILAHIGWVHWLNHRVASRELASAAERDLRQAVRDDPSNVFANVMLGSWIIQAGGRTEEGLEHLGVAAAANRERPFVRRLQLGVMTYPRDPQTRAALIQAANEMRKNREPLDDRQTRRILSAFDPATNSAEELKQTIAAVAPVDAWATYLWLEERRKESDDAQAIRRDFIQACVLEAEGKGQEAQAAFAKLGAELKRRGYDGRIRDHVDTAIARLSVAKTISH